MDYQVLFNIAATISAFFAGWVLNNITKTMDRIDADLRELPKNYVSKIDYRADLGDIKALLQHISDKLDNKADKP